MKRLFVTTALLVLTAFVVVQAQPAQPIRGEYSGHMNPKLSEEENIRYAFQQARIAALGREFGMLIGETNVSTQRSVGGEAVTDFLSVGLDQVKGEWIKDTGRIESPVIEYDRATKLWSIYVWVEGLARPITRAGIDFTALLLQRYSDREDPKRYATDSFFDGDSFYLYFCSPVDGYLTVYLVSGGTAYCLLPYENDRSGRVKVDAGREELFFAVKDPLTGQADGYYTMTCDGEAEENRFYVIFSPEKFVKAKDNGVFYDEETLRPRNLPIADFERWLAKNQLHDKEMAVKMIPTVVKKRR